MADHGEKNPHENHRARMQARVERDGLESLAEHEALEYLLYLSIPRQDTNELAHRLIQHFGSFCRVMEATEQELLEVKGVGTKSARLICTTTAFGRYYSMKCRKPRSNIAQTEDAIRYVKPLFWAQQNEIFYVIALDNQCTPITDLRVAEGISNHLMFNTKKLMRDVARINCPNVLLAHNHPGGLPIPSDADIRTTQALMDCLWQIGVHVVDHIIVAGEEACSLVQRGMMPTCMYERGRGAYSVR